MEHKLLTKHAGKTALGTMFSRILGYVRDMLVANFFGAGIFADAFYAAFRIPNLFRRMLGEGAFSAAFIPVFSYYLHTYSKDETQKLINAVFTALLIVLTIITILGIFFSPILVKLIVWGFADEPDKLQLTVELARLMFPFILFICLAAFLLAALNTLYSFFWSALAPSALSFAEIIYMLAVIPIISGEQNAIKGLAIAVIVGGAIHFFIQYPVLKKLGWGLKFSLNLKHPGIKKIALLMIPSIIGLSVDQINAFVDNICASFLQEGAISALYYSNRIMQLPLAIFGLALSTVALPAMSRAAALKDIVGLKNSLNFSIRLSLFALLPAGLGLMLIGYPIVQVLFERGSFDSYASLTTNNALFYYALGLPSFSITKLFANAFYSFQDTKTPVRTAAASMILHVILCIVLMYPMNVGGLALATSIAGYFNLALLVILLRKKIGALGIKKIVLSTTKAATAAAAACFGTLFIYSSLNFNVYAAVFVSIVSACIIFAVISKFLKSEELDICMSIFTKRRING
ncbi:MAG: murein biosynthesis integral membrane protein MurJ [Elusimicrobiota bacterium]|jgi:putative peptidoglycan lipid II flippase|nr:murein biosynthesis integral membrane protein MurJ [Elusimicrobiota bacterium]